jgi:hypothetical protein
MVPVLLIPQRLREAGVFDEQVRRAVPLKLSAGVGEVFLQPQGNLRGEGWRPLRLVWLVIQARIAGQ